MNWYKLSENKDLYKDIERFGPEGQDWIDPTEMDPRYLDDDFFGEFRRREQFRKNYSYAVPTKDSIERIKQFVGSDKVLEIGAGLGLWAKLMIDSGISITPVDIPHHENSYFGMDKQRYVDILTHNHNEAISKFGDHSVLMMVWPPYDNPMANEALKTFSGNKLIFTGEGKGGCTGNDCFFDTLENNWKRIGSIDILQWRGLHDDMTFWVRK